MKSGELSRQNISLYVTKTLHSQVKRSPLLWLHNRFGLLQQKIEMKWFGISFVFM